MSSHSMGRSAWKSTKWLWLVLALCLIGWRVSSRLEQYRSSVVSPSQQGQVSFFDANERNVALLDASRTHARTVCEHNNCLLPVAWLEPPVRPAYEREWEDRDTLPPIYTNSVSLYSNPPPSIA